jgi:hypothetical protein
MPPELLSAAVLLNMRLAIRSASGKVVSRLLAYA